MAGILGIYGLIVAVILNGKGKATDLLSNSPFLLNTPCSSTLNWKLHIRHGIQAPRLRTDLRSLLPRSWFRYRHCWRRWCESKRTIGSNLRWHDPYSHLRWGSRSLRHDRRYHPLSVSSHMAAFAATDSPVKETQWVTLKGRSVRACPNLKCDSLNVSAVVVEWLTKTLNKKSDYHSSQLYFLKPSLKTLPFSTYYFI